MLLLFMNNDINNTMVYPNPKRDGEEVRKKKKIEENECKSLKRKVKRGEIYMEIKNHELIKTYFIDISIMQKSKERMELIAQDLKFIDEFKDSREDREILIKNRRNRRNN